MEKQKFYWNNERNCFIEGEADKYNRSNITQFLSLFFVILYLIHNVKDCFPIIKNDLIISDNISIFLQ